MEMTAEGAQARSIMRWAWQEPEARAVEALEKVNELAAKAPGPQALAEIRDAAAMLARLVSSVNGGSLPAMGGTAGNAPDTATVSEQARYGMISGQVDLAAIHGHHIKGTAYTYRHGWVPLIGQQISDKYPSWLGREITQRQQAAKKHHGKAVPSRNAAGPAPKSVVHRSQRPQAPYRSTAASAAKARQARTASPAPAPKQAGVPKTAGEKLQAEDPALAKLAEPGASVAALKAYIDARVAAEVARQMGQITDQQHNDLQKALKHMHQSQQKLIAFIRKERTQAVTHEGQLYRTKLGMYSLFSAAGVAVAVAGLTGVIPPVTAAIAAGLVPLAQTIHDYVRRTF